MPRIGDAPNGEDNSADGTEKIPVTGSKWMLISTIAAYIRTLTQTLTGKTINLTDNTLTGTKAQFNTAVSDGDITYDAFKTIAVSGQSDVVADSATDTLTLAAGSNVTITTNAGTDTVTIAAAGGNSFGTVAVSGQTDVVADAANDTLTLAAGSGVTITTTAGSDTVTIANTGSAFVLNVDTTPVGNITTGEDDLISYSVPADTLDTNSQYIHFTFGGIFASSVNNKRIRVKFGSTTLFDTGALVITAAGDWSIEGYIVRTGSATQRCIVEFESNETALSGSADYVDATEDLTTILALKATGEGTASDDIIQKFQIVEKGGGAAAGGGGSGGMVLLEQHTASSSATLDFTTAITSTYDEYMIELVNVIPASSGINFYMRMSTDGGSTFDTGNNYSWAGSRHSNDGSAQDGNTPSSKGAQIQLDGGSLISNNSAYGVSGSLRLFSPLSTSLNKIIRSEVSFLDTQGTPHLIDAKTTAVYVSATAVNAVRFLFSSGNINSGTIRVYGIAKS